MNRHTAGDERATATVLDSHLGLLGVEAEREFQEHLSSCSVCRAEREALGRLVAGLRGAVRVGDPDPALERRLWARLLARLAATPELAPGEVRAAPGVVVSIASEREWRARGPAMREIVLRRDEDAGTITRLLSVAPGTRLAEHHHENPEECYVIQGDLRVGDATMRAGDYQRVDAGSLHPEQFTADGCLLLVVGGICA